MRPGAKKVKGGASPIADSRGALPPGSRGAKPTVPPELLQLLELLNSLFAISRSAVLLTADK
jgi:hypothetical protein